MTETYWVVDLEPVDDNPVDVDNKADEEGRARGKNLSGIGIVLTNGTRHIEIDRVAFRRRNSSDPKVRFRKALRSAISDAEKAADELNDAACRVDDAIAAAQTQARATLREIEGDIQRVQSRLSDLLSSVRQTVGAAQTEMHQAESEYLRPRAADAPLR